MMTSVETRSYPLPPVSLSEVLRYSGCREGNTDTEKLARICIAESEGVFCGKVCFGEFPVLFSGDMLDLGFACVRSASLAKALEGCGSAVLFAATVGLEIDRLIKKYSIVSPARAVMLQAVGAERIEALCDAFCAELEAKAQPLGLVPRPRFSPGYGDLPLELQTHIFRALDCPKRIGLTLNESLLMSPTKSVTAIVGLKKRA